MAMSVHQRPGLLSRLRQERFDLLIVGGGITGAGVARDATLRGLRVALVERDDFASGTSSRSSKLIHGGLRYLEQGDVGLVFESVRERQRLMKLAPHLARPLSFIVPVFDHSKRSVLVLDLGLTIYDTLAAGSGVLRHRAFRRDALLRHEPKLRKSGLRGGVRYFDAQTDDARLVLANIRHAHRTGAVCVSRVAFERPLTQRGPVGGAMLRDMTDGKAFEVQARTIVLAAGPWSDEALTRWLGHAPARPLIRPSKGVHVVVPRSRLPLSHAVVMSAADDRVVFALPWPNVTVLGTTDTRYSGPLDLPRTTASDARYLMDTANAHLDAEGGPLDLQDVVSTWAGIRPLAVGTRDDVSGTYQTSREHIIQSDPRGMILVAGGKLTTYRVMAEETVDEAMKLLPADRLEGLLTSPTARLALPGADGLPGGRAPLEAFTADLCRRRACSGAIAGRLVLAHGSDADAVLALCRATEGGLKPVVPGLGIRWGELRWAVQEEMAMDLLDVAVRRLPLYFYAGERLVEVLPEMARRVAQWCGYDAGRADSLAAGLLAHIEAHRVVPDGEGE